MKKRIGSILMTLALCLTLLPATAWAAGTDTTADVWDGTSVDTEWYDENTSATTYTLTTAAQLAGLAQLVNGTAEGYSSPIKFKDVTIKLDADIVLNEDGGTQNWTPIGTSNDNSFRGTFDGQGHTVSGLYISITQPNATMAIYLGLFGYVKNGTVQNVNVEGAVTVQSSSSIYVGGVVGYGSKATVEKCTYAGEVTGTMTTQESNGAVCSGGIAGFVSGGKVTNCLNSAAVTGEAYIVFVGGVVGENEDGNSVKNCGNFGPVKSIEPNYGMFFNRLGGVVGYNGGNATVSDSYSTGSVTSSETTVQTIGGVIGYHGSGTVSNCYFLKNEEINSSLDATGKNYATTTNVEPKTADQFASGEVAYLLSSGSTSGSWYQNLGGDDADNYPTLDSTHAQVAKLGSTYVNTSTEDDGKTYYLISTPEQLKGFADAVNSGQTTISAKLVDNIDLSTVCGEAGSWTPIGKNERCQFKGTFDGNGNTISNLTVNGNGYIGLFGFVYSGGVVKNLAVIGNVSGIGSYSDAIGGMVGYNNGTVTNCSFSGTVSCGESGGWMGGVVGYNNNGTVTNCSFSGTVSGGKNSAYIGGVVGNNLGTVKYCSNTGTVSGGEDSYVIGGVVGYSNGAVEFCYNTGDVSGGGHSPSQIGGVAGYNASQVTNCYNTGNVSSDGNDDVQIGGVAGRNDSTVTNCYNSGNVSGKSPIGGVVGFNFGGTMSNCYYLKSDVVNAELNSTDSVSNGTVTKVESKNSIAFASGEVAYLLQNEQEGTVWVQIEDENGTLYPTLYALLSEEEHAQIRAVYVVTFQVNDDNNTDFPTYKYAVAGGTVAEIPAAPEGATWCVGNEEFTASTVVTGDLTVVAKTNQDAPAAPALASRTTTSITLKEVEANENGAAAQYGISADGGTTWTWQASPEFTDLASDTEYTFAVRYGATDSHAPSPASETAKFSTDKPSVVDPVVPVTPPAVVTPTYPPAVEGADNGTVSITPANPRKGSTVTVTPKPETGYEVDSITVTDKNSNPVQVTDNGDGTYSFTQPASKVTVAVTFTETKQPTPDLPFTDVNPTTWYAEAVSYMLERGLMTGTAPDTFSPNSTTTRAMIVTILYRLEGAPGTNGDTAFTDVEQGTWYTDPIAWAAANGVVEGTTPTTFAPNAPVTREQMATILYRYLAAKGYDVAARADLSGYTDAEKISAYAKDAMSWANALGLITGERPDTLTPQGNATRAQVAEILMRYCIAMEQ